VVLRPRLSAPDARIRQVEAVVGQRATLHCPIVLQPQQKQLVRWLVDLVPIDPDQQVELGQEVGKYSISPSTFKLTIHRVALEDEGTYFYFKTIKKI
jgi:hypothetical protein